MRAVIGTESAQGLDRPVTQQDSQVIPLWYEDGILWPASASSFPE